MRQPEDRYHDTRTGEFVTDAQGMSDPAGTVLVDHEEKQDAWMKEWAQFGRLMKAASLDDDSDLLDTLAIQSVIHVQVLKRV